MKTVRVVRARPGRHAAWALQLDIDASVADAIVAIRQIAPEALDAVAGYAVFGVRVQPETVLGDGDRLELLEALQTDPKDARRRRAAASRGDAR
ncbi:RnfH family protein [Luteimonas sp. 3794]|uniref:RnfH family protein n=1 Tax=Luteimonas sp. 3794 TaxID=2817730 RepID=UPI0028641D8B|nr:RnfH family protein [Luteimonas sp. 3794]MDR6990757.1 putative ubiquitin-RnfH superfamily antitoxin RatB of RatAB toxin-antitoxin module [Luteimonas sp. 3794]